MPEKTQDQTEPLQRQKVRLESILHRLEIWDKRYILARLICFLAGVIAMISLFFLQAGQLAVYTLAFFVAIFSAIVFLHRRLDRSRQRFRFALTQVFTQLARQHLEWSGIPASRPVHVDPIHPFAADLNLVGERSLHQLIDTATSRGGSQRLAAWLLNPIPERDTILSRHAVLQELIPLVGFRSRLALRGMLINAETQGQWDGEQVLQWLESRITPRSFLPILALLTTLAVLNIFLFVLNLSSLLPPYWIAGVGLYMFIYLAQYNRFRSLFEDTYALGKSLNQFKSILEFLENASYANTPQLARLLAPFTISARQPSRYLRKVVWITLAAAVGNNQVLSLLINAVIPWNLWFASILNKTMQALQEPLRGWLAAWYELEAHCSMANFAWLNPGYAFPELIPVQTHARQAVFKASGLGHPLIPENRRVRNDFSIQQMGNVAIITGSNMSGKSTFLRTVGANLCLANAGGPVVAVEMQTRLFRPFTCIQVTDSLADGISYFYAEVRRLKQLLIQLEEPSPYPVFFLIDEIYRGTNNRERRIGSQAYIHALSHSQGVGLVSTHDLDLVQLSNLESSVLNYHFRETIQDDRMIYDYHLRPGPSPTTNALKIMEIEGLPVNELKAP